MRSLVYVIGVIVILVILFSSAVVGAGICIRGVGCVYSTGDGVRADSSQQATISVR
jgi:hypothetical protein